MSPFPAPKTPGRPEPKHDIYIDGCCEPNPSRNIGIGIRCDEAGIYISQQIDMLGTNNVAECLAAIRALEECQRLGLTDVRLLSDSDLVVNWVRGRYALKSETARTYVPTIRSLLDEVRGTIAWVSGHDNKADRPSREAIGAYQETSTDPLSVVVNSPIDKLKFRHFAKLKSGRDQYTAMRLDKLRLLVPDHARVTERLADKSEQAKALRWMLRGLDLDKAVRKVETDREVSANCRSRARMDFGDWRD